MPRGKPPTFAGKSESYSMSIPPTIEAVRLLELRKATQDLIALLQAQGWLSENSTATSEMEACWLSLYNEYVERFEALEGAETRAKLFGANPHYAIGYNGPMNYKLLEIGDCVLDPTGDPWKVVDKTNINMVWTRPTGGKLPPVSFDDGDTQVNITYVGRDVW